MMAMESAHAVRLGDPAPWFGGATITGGHVDIHVNAGRWISLSFLGSLAEESAQNLLAELLGLGREVFAEDHLIFYAIVSAPLPRHLQEILAPIVGPALNFIIDTDGEIARLYGAAGSPRTIILDPLLNVVADVALDDPGGHTKMIGDFWRSLPPPSDSVGVPLVAPVLILPRVFEFEFCDYLVKLFDEVGGEESGFMFDSGGQSRTVLNAAFKRRSDMLVVDPNLREMMRDRLERRVAPAMERFFKFRPTRADRYLVSCYDAADGGHFYRHRDDINAGARHRRFAMTIGLNRDYEGGELRFPEFGGKLYKPPVGGALIFSCGMLHEVMPMLAGRRFVFVPFFYGEQEVAGRLAANADLAPGEDHYEAGADRLSHG